MSLHCTSFDISVQQAQMSREKQCLWMVFSSAALPSHSPSQDLDYAVALIISLDLYHRGAFFQLTLCIITLAYPLSPQYVPQEFLTCQNSVPFSTPQPTTYNGRKTSISAKQYMFLSCEQGTYRDFMIDEDKEFLLRKDTTCILLKFRSDINTTSNRSSGINLCFHFISSAY